MSLFSPILWAFLPSQLSHILIPNLSTYLPSFFPPAPKGTKGYQNNHRWVTTILVVGYLGWTFLSAGSGFGYGTSGASGDGEGVGRDWYELLGVGIDVDEDGLKKAFRSLSRVYHPDKSPHHAEHFIRLRSAYDGLGDPVKRFAYDRFGPDIAGWKAASYREYMRQGMTQSVGFYVTSVGFLFVLSVLGRAQEAAYWRNTLLLCLFIAESSLILSNNSIASSIPISLHRISPRILLQPAFLQIRFLHRAFTSVSIGITQLAGLWVEKPNEERALVEVVTAIRAIELEALGAFQETAVPLLSRGNALQVESLMLKGMEQDRAVSSHPQIRPIWQDAIQRARDEAKHVRHRYFIPDVKMGSVFPAGYTTSSHIPNPSSKGRERGLPRYHDDRSDGAGEGEVDRVELDIDIAAGIPLPASPPASPRLLPRLRL